MHKINVTAVISRHIDTLRSDDRRLLWRDVLTFYLAPIIGGLAFWALGWRIPKDAVSLSITVFAIFAALLLSVQVALYSVSLRPLGRPDDPKKNKAYESISAVRATVMRELNDNIAYLVLLSVLSVTLLLALFALGDPGELASAVIFSIYLHFFLTLLMVLKRASIVFSREYEVDHSQ